MRRSSIPARRDCQGKARFSEGTKSSQRRGGACPWDGCKVVENLSVPKPLRTGTGAIRQELLINSSQRSSDSGFVTLRLSRPPGLRNTKIFSQTLQMSQGHAPPLRWDDFWLSKAFG